MTTTNERFLSDAIEATNVYPSLRLSAKDNLKILTGTLPVVDTEGRFWEDYMVEIHCPENYPHAFPILYEISEKIPKIADWHIFEDTLACCVKVKPEEILRCKKGITVTEYIEEEVLPYLFNQTHRRINGFYVNGEYAHGQLGIYEFYSNTLKTGDDLKLTLNLMTYVAKNHPPSRANWCFCGRKSKYRHCHRQAFEKLKSLGDKTIMNDIYNLSRAFGRIHFMD